MTQTLYQKMAELAESKAERVRNMSPAAIETADAAFMAMAEAVVPLFVDDEKGTNVDRMGGVRVASMFLSEMLQELSKHPKEEVDELLQNGL